ncbi:hypothetical protein [Oenococcus oeni]|uniref:Uncharacterized protein n=3 Tax=Oenococcus oeni TaxID=1247 RepID=Q04DT9_OENOB|nr:hypothetical protein [Oenococcus oeni]ABJ57383.1 hypothetical protein OEOE_1526 [Oenococcus oeni PSU-1]EFD87726.1 hypothetical protein AWRIB429_1552 [Oenococcus oeni AWRIB429]EJN92356.1 hypothetical protein AWRIB304_778 [Oenococcus oeni AWRIB304]EJO00823.1 hypothetical protein AWRIB318_975 [Oenococcus oeni AWRIB318]EJO10210.1 hypothetical protein AWRIB576_984 [Oenococcus oeni AWRIB576]
MSTLWLEILDYVYVILQQILFLALSVMLIWGGFFIKNHGLGGLLNTTSDVKDKKPATKTTAKTAAKAAVKTVTKIKGQYKAYAWLYIGMWILSGYFIMYQVIFSLVSLFISGSSSSGTSSY